MSNFDVGEGIQLSENFERYYELAILIKSLEDWFDEMDKEDFTKLLDVEFEIGKLFQNYHILKYKVPAYYSDLLEILRHRLLNLRISTHKIAKKYNLKMLNIKRRKRRE